MTEDDTIVKLWSLNRQLASLRFKYYELFTNNRILAMKLFGYRATEPGKFPDELVKRMEFYVFRAGMTKSLLKIRELNSQGKMNIGSEFILERSAAPPRKYDVKRLQRYSWSA